MPEKHRNIFRGRQVRKSGTVSMWQVRFHRNKELYSATFRDDHYGGEDHALAAAIRYREEMQAVLDVALPLGKYGRWNPGPETTPHGYRRQSVLEVEPRMGLYLIRREGAYWVAAYLPSEAGAGRVAIFSVDVHGAEIACYMAALMRSAHEDGRGPHHPTTQHLFMQTLQFVKEKILNEQEPGYTIPYDLK